MLIVFQFLQVLFHLLPVNARFVVHPSTKWAHRQTAAVLQASRSRDGLLWKRLGRCESVFWKTRLAMTWREFIWTLYIIYWARAAQSVHCLTTDWTAGVRSRQRQRIFPLTSASRPALGPTQPPVQWVPGALCPGVKRGRGVMLTTHPLPVPRSGKSRSYTSCHPERIYGA
jgi:hypothetical protein